MLSYLPCGLSAERSYIAKKAHLQLLFSRLFDHEGILISLSDL